MSLQRQRSTYTTANFPGVRQRRVVNAFRKSQIRQNSLTIQSRRRCWSSGLAYRTFVELATRQVWQGPEKKWRHQSSLRQEKKRKRTQTYLNRNRQRAFSYQRGHNEVINTDIFSSECSGVHSGRLFSPSSVGFGLPLFAHSFCPPLCLSLSLCCYRPFEVSVFTIIIVSRY